MHLGRGLLVSPMQAAGLGSLHQPNKQAHKSFIISITFIIYISNWLLVAREDHISMVLSSTATRRPIIGGEKALSCL